MADRRTFLKSLGAALPAALLAPRAGFAAAPEDGASVKTGRYHGMDDGAAWRRDALARIEEMRRASFEIRLQDADGQPLAGVPVRIEMQRHAFGFGGAVQPRHLFELGGEERRAFYRDVTRRYFHRVTISNGLKWKHHAAQKHNVERFLGWCLEHDLPVRGHCLVWGGFRRIPDELGHLRFDRPALREAIEQHIIEFASMYDEPLIEWDVLNEPWSDHEFMDLLGNEVVHDWFHLAEKANPGLTRWINDYGVLTRPSPRHQDFYFDYIANLLAHKVPVQGIGFQGHIPERFEPTPPEELLATMDRFAALGLPLQVTEFDFETTDRDLQARYTADFLIAVFSHPAMTGLVTWTPFEYAKGRGPKPDAAFFDWRLREKPNASAWHELVNERWATRLEAVSDANGRLRFSGFKGRYALSAGNDSRAWRGRANFSEDGDRFTLTRPRG